eukprot:gi/632983269/ref/XP_007908563.1/ PREDICTED: uncharacterized protein LOC103189840 [Callorhinchus milii]
MHGPYIAQKHLSVYDCDDGKMWEPLNYYAIGSADRCYAWNICDHRLSSNTGYRVRYFLVDHNRVEIMSTNWSDEFRTKSALPYQSIHVDGWRRSAAMIIITVLCMCLLCLLLLALLLMCCYKRKRTGIMINNWTGYNTHFTKGMHIRERRLEMQRGVEPDHTPFFLHPQDHCFNANYLSKSWKLPPYNSADGGKSQSLSKLMIDDLLHASDSWSSRNSDKLQTSTTSGSVQTRLAHNDLGKASLLQIWAQNDLGQAGLDQTRLAHTDLDQVKLAQNDFAQAGLIQTTFTQNGLGQTGLAQNDLALTGIEKSRSAQSGLVETTSTQNVLGQTGLAHNDLILTKSAQNDFVQAKLAGNNFAHTGLVQTTLVQNSLTQDSLAQTTSSQNTLEQNGLSQIDRVEVSAGVVQADHSTQLQEKRFSDTSSLVQSIRSGVVSGTAQSSTRVIEVVSSMSSSSSAIARSTSPTFK